MNDADIEMAEAAEAANAAANTKGRRPFDPERDGDQLAAAVRDAVTYFNPVYPTITAVADDYGFAHDDAADHFAFEVAMAAKRELEAEMREARRG